MDEVQYTMTRDDVWHLQLYALSRQLRRTLRLRLIIISVVLVCLFIFVNQLFSGDYRLSILVVGFTLFLALFLLFLTYSLLFLQMWLAASRSNEMLGKSGVNVLAISEQGVQLRNEISNGTSSWRAYKAIEEDKRNIYFVMDQPGRVFMARLIPKRAFESSSQAERFMARARGYWQEQARQVATSHS
jgi:ABC-type multidrug transport system fused ATPase/permease subunit